jgi:CDGSH-type Zn-finger protein
MENKSKKGRVTVTKNGPYIVNGNLPLAKEIIVADENGDSVGWKKGEKYSCPEEYALCRCGASKNKPFCDGSHVKTGFDGTETARRENFSERCETIEGSGLDLDDLPELCARARFCHDQLGDVWGNTEQSGNSETKQKAIKQANLCPSGRLVACEKKTGKAIEPSLEREVGLVEDPQSKVSGPVWVKGGVEIESADGTTYETRNRVTLCRCGKSANKPFCNGCHIDEKFNDGDKNVS